jgi:hypothetical protein
MIMALAPAVAVLTMLFDAAAESCGIGVAHTDSPAMKEIFGITRKELFDASNAEAAFSNAVMLRFAASDAVRQFAKMFEVQPVPVLTHLAVARIGIEAAAIAYWLSDPEINAEERVQRYEMLALRNALEMKRSPDVAMKARGSVSLAQVRGRCQKRGWNPIANEKRVAVAGINLPGSKVMIEDLLNSDDSASGLSLGAQAWWFWSGTSHATNYALLDSVDVSGVNAGSEILTVVSFVVSAPKITWAALILGHGFVRLMNRQQAFFGWPKEPWDSAVEAFGQLVRDFGCGMASLEAPSGSSL